MPPNPTLIEEFKKAHAIHSYIRVGVTDDGKKYRWKCNDPLCNHVLTVPKNNRKLLIGRATLCPKCSINTFILTSKDVHLATPICNNCKMPEEKKKDVEKAKVIVEDILKGVFQE